MGRLDDDDGDDARPAAPADGVAVGSMTPVPGLVDSLRTRGLRHSGDVIRGSHPGVSWPAVGWHGRYIVA